MNKTETFSFFPLRFETIIIVLTSYATGIALTILIKVPKFCLLLKEILQYGYPIISGVILINFFWVSRKIKTQKFKKITIPFFLILIFWCIVYYMLFKISIKV